MKDSYSPFLVIHFPSKASGSHHYRKEVVRESGPRGHGEKLIEKRADVGASSLCNVNRIYHLPDVNFSSSLLIPVSQYSSR